MSTDQLQYDVRDRIATITFDRPDRLNAWTPVLEASLREAVARADADAAVRVIVLTGAGRAFCAGADLAVARPRASMPPEAVPGDFAQRYSYLLATRKPLVAAINGAAIGVGACIALYCDLRYMAGGAKLAFPYARRGLVAEHGSAWMLGRLVGPMHAADLLLTGRTVLAEEAAAMGLVAVVDAVRFREEVGERVGALASACSPRSLRIIKAQLRRVASESLAEATAFADEQMHHCFDTADFREGVAHFLEKRAPRFEDDDAGANRREAETP